MALSRKYSLGSIWVVLLFGLAIISSGSINIAIAQNEQDSPEQAQQIETNENTNTDKEYLNSKVSPKPFDRETWNKKRKGLNYSDKKKDEKTQNNKEGEDRPKSENEDEVTENRQNNTSYSSPDWGLNLGPLVQMIVIAGVIILLALLIFLVIKSGLFQSNTSIKQSSISGAELLENIEDNLHESDLDRALRLALEANDYRLAIRIYYLTIIKELSLKDMIKWKRDKTNGQYVREMLEKPEGAAFRSLTVSFERAWYSNETIMLKHFEALNPQFQSFISAIKKPKP
jgi:hypothetical protein